MTLQSSWGSKIHISLGDQVEWRLDQGQEMMQTLKWHAGQWFQVKWISSRVRGPERNPQASELNKLIHFRNIWGLKTYDIRTSGNPRELRPILIWPGEPVWEPIYGYVGRSGQRTQMINEDAMESTELDKWSWGHKCRSKRVYKQYWRLHRINKTISRLRGVCHGG